MADDVEAKRERRSEIDADAKNPASNESKKEGSGQQRGPQNCAKESLV
jgi:hypothetical protein